MRPVTRIPLTITATATGQETKGVLVAVLATDLDALEVENGRLRDGLEQVGWINAVGSIWRSSVATTPPTDAEPVYRVRAHNDHGRAET